MEVTEREIRIHTKKEIIRKFCKNIQRYYADKNIEVKVDFYDEEQASENRWKMGIRVNGHSIWQREQHFSEDSYERLKELDHRRNLEEDMIDDVVYGILWYATYWVEKYMNDLNKESDTKLDPDEADKYFRKEPHNNE